MENVRKISKKYYLRQIICCWLVFYMLFCFGMPVRVAMAEVVMTSNPTGTITVTPLNAGITQDMTATHGAIGNFSDFDIATGHTVTCDQTIGGVSNALSQALFRVTGNGTEIYGTFNANGGIWLIDPAGILVGSSGAINVNSLVASSLNISDAAFTSGLADGIFQFTGGGLGDVINEGTITAEAIALIGKQVGNRGALVAPGGYVIMAAGDSVKITTDDMVSDVVVEVSMPEQTPGNYDYIVDNGEGPLDPPGDGYIETDHVILAAGDIWSAAIEGVETLRAEAKGNVVFTGDIHAEAGPGSDAIADVTIITGGDFTVEGYTITAEADAAGVPDTDATATVSITADGDVKVNADGPLTSALIEAKAENGEKNEAKVNIKSTNGDVTVESEGMYEWAVIKAEAEDGIENIADITIAADGDVKVTNQGGFFIIIPDLDIALIEAIAHEGTTNTATVDIDAGDIVEVVSNEFSLGALIRAEAKNKIELDPDIPAPVADEVVVVDLDTIQGLVNTATVDITATTVEIRGEKLGSAAVEAIARNDIEVDIDNDDGEVAVNLTVADLQNNAGVTITANNKDTADYDDGDVRVTAKSKGAAGIKAEAYNEIEIKHHKYADNPATMNLTLDGLVNNADVVIGADDDVEVTSEDWLSDAGIEAEAWNKLEVVESKKGGDTTVNLTVDDLQNNAGIDITTAVDSVMVSGLNSGKAGIRASVWNKLEIDESYKGGETTLNLTVDGLVRNTADVVIDAEIDVEVTAECEGDCSKAEIIALANNWLDDAGEILIEAAGLVENNAGIDITAGEDVRVIAIDCGDATIAAVAENEVDLTVEGLVENNADVVINAGDDVLVQAAGGKHGRRGFTPSQASIEAVADVATDNDADVTIGATNVEVTAESGGEAGIGATAQHALNENNADVTITASGDVKVKASGVGSGPPSEAAIEAIAEWGNNNNAGVTITAGGNVEVAGGVDDRRGIAGIVATAAFSTNNTADVTITADNVKLISGNVEEGYKGTAEIIAGAWNAFGPDSENNADVTITTDGDVLVHGGTSEETAQIRAEAMFGNDNTADILINAGGDVEVKAGDAWYEHQGKAEIVAAAFGGTTNTADVTINAGGDVKVMDLYGGKTAKIKAEAVAADYADAAITINAENVTVTGDPWGGHAEISAYADASFGADATVDITLTGSDLTVGYGGSIYADADVWGPEAMLGVPENGPETRDATAEVTILADGQVTVEQGGRIYTDATVHIGYPAVYGLGDPVMIPGDATATTTIKAGTGVTVEGSSGQCGPPPGAISADASIQYNYWGGQGEPYVVEGYRPDAIATVDIQTCGDVIVDGLIRSHAWIYDTSDMSYPDELFGDTTADVIVKAYGDVIVNSEDEEENGFIEINNSFGGSNGQIEALAHGGLNNSAGITVLAVGDVIVNNGSGYIAQITQSNGGGYIYSPEEIRAEAYNGHTNSAHIGIATRPGDDGDVIVSGQIGAHTRDSWNIEGQDSSNTSNVEICAARDVIVNGGYALYESIGNPVAVLLDAEEGGQIFAGAQSGMIKGGSTNTANVDIYAGRDVTVHGAEIEYAEPLLRGMELTINGGYYDGGKIVANTGWSDNSENTSTIGIYAQRDVTLNGATVTGDPMYPPMLTLADSGQVLAGAHGNSSTDTAVVVICAQDDVTIDGKVRAEAGTGDGGGHYAYIAIAAGDEITGSGEIVADADQNAAAVEASITVYITNLVKLLFDGEAYSTTDGGDTKVDPEVVVGPVDCPECDFDWIDWTWCVDCEEEALFAPVAPLAQFQIPTIEGCPQLVQAAAMELGITAETIQVGIGNALALNPTIQPCQACAALVDAAGILRDEDGSRMAAMVQTFNVLAPAGAPFTPEMATSIAMAFEGAAEGTQYASVMEYIDAFVQYATALDTGLGSPTGDSVAFVLEKYGAGVTGSDNSNIASFVATRLEAIGG